MPNGYHPDCTVEVDLFSPFDEGGMPTAVARGPWFHGDCPLNNHNFGIYDGGIKDIGEGPIVNSAAWSNVDKAITFEGITSTHGAGFPFEVSFPCDIMEMTDEKGREYTCEDLEFNV